MLVLQTLAILQSVEVIRNPQTWREGSSGPRWKHLVHNTVDFVFILIAMGLSVTPVGYWGVDLLLFTYPATDIICDRWPRLKDHVGDVGKPGPKDVAGKDFIHSERTDTTW